MPIASLPGAGVAAVPVPLNLLFQWSELYQTGMSVAPVANQLYYDNIYQERYMGLPQEEMEPFVQGSPITHAKNLQGNLLLIHGTGDDNVHYQNSEALINELIKHNKQFSGHALSQPFAWHLRRSQYFAASLYPDDKLFDGAYPSGRGGAVGCRK
jgi:hypothetical protein